MYKVPLTSFPVRKLLGTRYGWFSAGLAGSQVMGSCGVCEGRTGLEAPSSVMGKLVACTFTLISPGCTFLVYKMRQRTHISQWSCEDEQNKRSKLLAESHDKQGGDLRSFTPLGTNVAQGIQCLLLGHVISQ